MKHCIVPTSSVFWLKYTFIKRQSLRATVSLERSSSRFCCHLPEILSLDRTLVTRRFTQVSLPLCQPRLYIYLFLASDGVLPLLREALGVRTIHHRHKGCIWPKGSPQNKFSVKVGNLAQLAWPPPPLPERWDFFREFVGNFRQNRVKYAFKTVIYKSWDWVRPRLLGPNSQLLPKICFGGSPESMVWSR